jgi:hypothetical protein
MINRVLSYTEKMVFFKRLSLAFKLYLFDFSNQQQISKIEEQGRTIMIVLIIKFNITTIASKYIL